jgi:hypothetical protein
MAHADAIAPLPLTLHDQAHPLRIWTAIDETTFADGGGTRLDITMVYIE